MHLPDRSPGLFIIAAFALVYGVIAVEAWMYATATFAAVAITFALIVVLALYLVSYFHHLLEDEDGEPVAAPVEAPARAPQAARPAPSLRGPVAAR
ncbi:MAG TPA: hypothetical protein VD931_09320 [Baekduia sp.]|nr:hypothetical protein [Baekduia sp.]